MSRNAWFIRLAAEAVTVDIPWLQVMSAVLASPSSSDALLCIADALDEAAATAALGPYPQARPQARDLAALAELFREEAPTRAEVPCV